MPKAAQKNGTICVKCKKPTIEKKLIGLFYGLLDWKMQLLYQFQLQFINDLHSIPHKSNFIAIDEIQIDLHQKSKFEVSNKSKN